MLAIGKTSELSSLFWWSYFESMSHAHMCYDVKECSVFYVLFCVCLFVCLSVT